MKRRLVSALCFFAGIVVALAANPKREMRATWLTTVNNIDWPTSMSPSLQQREMIRMLDSIKSLNLNTVLFQVRTCCDAFYESTYEPWSSFLKINRGQKPEYDPLAFVLEECHKRGLACHAWINPYRYSRTGAKWTGAKPMHGVDPRIITFNRSRYLLFTVSNSQGMHWNFGPVLYIFDITDGFDIPAAFVKLQDAMMLETFEPTWEYMFDASGATTASACTAQTAAAEVNGKLVIFTAAANAGFALIELPKIK